MPSRLKCSLLGLLSATWLACIEVVDKGGDAGLEPDAREGTGGRGGSSPSPDSGEPARPATPDAGPRPTPPAPSPPSMNDAGPMPPAASTDGGQGGLNAGLISRWKLDEASGNTTADSAGANAGMLSGPMRMAAGFPGAKYPNTGALLFDGEDDFVELGTANLPANNRPQSVAFWFNITAMPAEEQICVSLTDGADGGNRLKLGFRGNRVAAWKKGGDDLVTAPPVPAGWHHFAYTYDGTNHILYVDGSEAGKSTVAADTGAAAVARMGAGHNNAENFAGQLDEVRVYGRALTAAEVTSLRNGFE
jgi:hypothetical protein